MSLMTMTGEKSAALFTESRQCANCGGPLSVHTVYAELLAMFCLRCRRGRLFLDRRSGRPVPAPQERPF